MNEKRAASLNKTSSYVYSNGYKMVIKSSFCNNAAVYLSLDLGVVSTWRITPSPTPKAAP